MNGPAETAKIAAFPSLSRAWRGLWLFAWKSRLSLAQLPKLAGGLAILPFLVYLTVSTPESWRNRDALPMANQGRQLWQLQRRMARTAPVLTIDQRDKLIKIFQTEYDRVSLAWKAIESPETSVDLQRQLIQSYYDAVLAKAQNILGPDQFAAFRIWSREAQDRSQAQISEPAWNRTAPFYRWLVDFYFFIILPLGCIRATGGLVRDELQSDTLGFLLTRPIKRAPLLLIKFACEAAWLEVLALVEALLIFAVGQSREMPSLGELLPLFLATQFLAVLAWSALGVLFGQITKRYLALALVYGLVVELGIGAIPTNINTLSLMRHQQTLLSHNTELQSLFQWTTGGVLFPVGILLLATILFLAASALLFTFLEYHPTDEMRK